MARGFLATASVRIGSLLFAMWVMIGAGCTSSESVAPLPGPSATSPTSSNKSTPVIRAAAEIRQSQLMPLAPIGPPVDLLARVDTGRDAVRGVFVRQGKDVLIPAVRAAQLNVVSPLKPQYMLEMDVAKTSTGPGSLNLGFFVDGAIPAALIIDGWDKPVSAICSIDGRIGENNVSTRPLHVFTDSRVRTVRITVRSEGVFADLDGQPLVQFVGAKSQLSFDRRFFTQPLPNQLMLGGWEAEFRVSRWVLTPIGEPPLDLIGRPANRR